MKGSVACMASPAKQSSCPTSIYDTSDDGSSLLDRLAPHNRKHIIGYIKPRTVSDETTHNAHKPADPPGIFPGIHYPPNTERHVPRCKHENCSFDEKIIRDILTGIDSTGFAMATLTCSGGRSRRRVSTRGSSRYATGSTLWSANVLIVRRVRSKTETYHRSNPIQSISGEVRTHTERQVDAAAVCDVEHLSTLRGQKDLVCSSERLFIQGVRAYYYLPRGRPLNASTHACASTSAGKAGKSTSNISPRYPTAERYLAVRQ